MSDCIFCKIVNNEIPSYKIYENDKFFAFLDINPASEGHTLVIPKKHYETVWDIENIGDYMEVCKKIALNFQKITKHKITYSVVHGEGVAHAHIHLIPKTSSEIGDKLSKAMGTNKLDTDIALTMLEKYRLHE